MSSLTFVSLFAVFLCTLVMIGVIYLESKGYTKKHGKDEEK